MQRAPGSERGKATDLDGVGAALREEPAVNARYMGFIDLELRTRLRPAGNAL